MKEAKNLTTQSVTLADGTILAAAGHEGSTKIVAGFAADEDNAVAKQAKLDAQLDSLIENGIIAVTDKAHIRVVPPAPKQLAPELESQPSGSKETK